MAQNVEGALRTHLNSRIERAKEMQVQARSRKKKIIEPSQFFLNIAGIK